MRKPALLVLFALFPTLAQAQGMRKAQFVTDYDLTSTSYIFCVTTGQNNDPFQAPRDGSALITTSGSSTTVTALTANTLPFANLSVGDELIIVTAPGTTARRYITAKASGDSITVSSAITLSASGNNFNWLKVSCGTAATDGWIDIANYSDAYLLFWIQTLNATSIDVLAECEVRGNGSAPTQVFPPSPVGTGICEVGNFTAAQTRACAISLEPNVFDRCRVGVKLTADAGAQDFTAWLSARVRN